MLEEKALHLLQLHKKQKLKQNVRRAHLAMPCGLVLPMILGWWKLQNMVKLATDIARLVRMALTLTTMLFTLLNFKYSRSVGRTILSRTETYGNPNHKTSFGGSRNVSEMY